MRSLSRIGSSLCEAFPLQVRVLLLRHWCAASDSVLLVSPKLAARCSVDEMECKTKHEDEDKGLGHHVSTKSLLSLRASMFFWHSN